MSTKLKFASIWPSLTQVTAHLASQLKKKKKKEEEEEETGQFPLREWKK